MPRVDSGWIAIDRSLLKKMGYREITELAFQSRGILITSPSIVTVQDSLRSIRIALAIGSVLLPPTEKIELGYHLSRPEWVDGCQVGKTEGKKLERINSRERQQVKGRIVAVEPRDPIAVAINGIRGIFEVVNDFLDSCIPLAVVNKKPVLGITKDGSYCTNITSNPLAEFLEYITLMYTSCTGR